MRREVFPEVDDIGGVLVSQTIEHIPGGSSWALQSLGELLCVVTHICLDGPKAQCGTGLGDGSMEQAFRTTINIPLSKAYFQHTHPRKTIINIRILL